MADPVLGSYRSVWVGHATDAEIRYAGSSAGVLTALTRFMIDAGIADSVVGAGQSRDEPTATSPIEATTYDAVLGMSGSRYAPVAILPLVDITNPRQAVVGKPCEVAALRMHEARADDTASSNSHFQRPVLSFFCAGVPSMRATERAIERLGVRPEQVQSLRYRGMGWPGRFTVTSFAGESKSMSYEESWGDILGKDVQDRCKICPDGTGSFADVSVGDFWRSDANGYPAFNESDGISVVIVRTPLGERLVAEAVEAGVIALEPGDADAVKAVQPLQVKRAHTLWGRLLGRRLARVPVPRYQMPGVEGFQWRSSVPKLRAALGMWRRSRR
ncbi:Coenzyme F420 hydrogenase/dehydrogenase, beta subunit C-terminal domain [Gordonia sp. CNJ-863]|uniref:Coenzyme F420 hydrogenase/dehydrogenase, beta subunit C-terminal domain n=1 Tax=Gordonia sp. CNJ-863 TaxID=1904963 RepID=UPI0037C03844